MDKLITIIVPIYNVAKFLPRCIESLLAQTYPNLEIILVDDGSPDRCGEICDQYALRDSRIKVIHKTNGGLSDARNAGLNQMTGEYVSFIDSDDWIDQDWCEKLMNNLLRFHADLSLSGIVSEYCHNGIVQSDVITKEYGNEPFCESGIEMMKRYFRTSWVAWDKIYRASIFDDIRFPVGEINEDEAIALQLLEKCERVAYTNEVFYHYIKRPESITSSSFSPKKFAWYRHCRDNLEWIREHHPELTEPAAARYRGALLWTLTEIAMSDKVYPAEQQDMLTELRNNRELFFRIPFDTMNEKIRFMMLSYLPFSLYRLFIRRKRSI